MNRNIQDPETWMINEIRVLKHRTAEYSGGGVTKGTESIRLKMNRGVEFTDEYGHLPIDRSYLRMDNRLVDDKPNDEDIEEFIQDTKL